MKDRLLDWVNDQRQLDVTSKFILYRLAQFADADCCAWAKITTLAEAVNVSERTVQYRLRQMVEADLLRDTGRQHRLTGSTRSVPIYQLAPEVEGLGAAVSMGAKPAPIGGVWVQNGEGMGASGLHPHKELKGTEERSNDLSERARVLEGVFDQVEAAYPGLGFSDRSMAWRAFLDLAGAGVAVADLPAAAAGYAADPILKRREYGPVSLQRWLSEGRYREWMPRKPAEPARTACASAVPAEIVAELEAAASESVATYLAPAEWRAADRTIIARTGFAAERIVKRVGQSKLEALTLRVEHSASLGG